MILTSAFCDEGSCWGVQLMRGLSLRECMLNTTDVLYWPSLIKRLPFPQATSHTLVESRHVQPQQRTTMIRQSSCVAHVLEARQRRSVRTLTVMMFSFIVQVRRLGDGKFTFHGVGVSLHVHLGDEITFVTRDTVGATLLFPLWRPLAAVVCALCVALLSWFRGI